MFTQTPTQELACFICNLEYNDLPDKVIDKMKSVLLDGIACGCHGSKTTWGKAVYEFVQELGGPHESSLWFTHFKGPAVNVALALGVSIHAFDFDDYHKSKVHPAAVVIPAAMTLYEKEGTKRNTKDFITAMVAGYETMIRVSLSVNPSASRLKGWHLTGTCGVYAAAATAGKLLGLNEEQMTWALGLAGTQAAGLWAFNYDGAMSKRFHPGRSSQSGIMAAILAKKGFTGPKRILDAEDGGFWAATSDKPRPEKLLEKIGFKYECVDTCIKPYACCGSNHSSIDAVRSIMRENNVSVEEIKEITIFTSKVVKTQTGFDYLPETVLQAQMSLKYAVSAGAVFGIVLPVHMEEIHFSSPQMKQLMNKVIIKIDPEMDSLYPEHFCSKVAIKVADGNEYICKIIDPLGSQEHPLTWDMVAEKARTLMERTLDQKRTDKLISIIKNIEDIKDISAVSRLLQGR